MAVKPAGTQAVAPAAAGMSWKTQTYLIGAAVGLLLGLLSAYLFVRASQENAKFDQMPQKVKTGDMMKLTLSVLALVRQITEMGNRG